MLSEMLSKDDCKNCRICCSFDSSDIWETPVITEELRRDILDSYPEMRFVKKDDCYLFRMEKEEDEDLYYCSVLDHENGCVLGENKPFDCKIWPLRIMDLNGSRVITLSPVCPVMFKKPVDELCALAKKLAPVIFGEADRHPSIVKKYIVGYPILAVEG